MCNDEFDRVEVLNRERDRERERLVIICDHESPKMTCATKIDEKMRKLYRIANDAKVQAVIKTQQRLLNE